MLSFAPQRSVVTMADHRRFFGAFWRTLLRRPALAWTALRWYVRGKRLRANNLLANETSVERGRIRRSDRFLARSPLGGITPIGEVLDLSRPVAVWVWSEGNFFFVDIAAYVVAFLQRMGARAVLFEEGVAPPKDHELVIVAPQEFCVHGAGKEWPAEALDRAVPLNTEQWHTSWFALARPFLERSGRGLDINPASAAGLARMGVRCGFVPLLPLAGTQFEIVDAPLSVGVTCGRYLPGLSWPARFLDRPIDVAFLGVTNRRRDRALAEMAPVLARHRCVIHAPEFLGPVRSGDADMIGARDFAQIARNAKILLNIHQGESHYFEWHRIVVCGIMEGCVVVSEPNLATGIVQAGAHLLEAPLRGLPAFLAWLLETEAGRAEMAAVHGRAMALRGRLMAAAGTPCGMAGLCLPG